jgi:hypothetical protein
VEPVWGLLKKPVQSKFWIGAAIVCRRWWLPSFSSLLVCRISWFFITCDIIIFVVNCHVHVCGWRRWDRYFRRDGCLGTSDICELCSCH